VTSVPVGTTVHDKATVSGSGGTPSGNVTFEWFTNNACTAPAADTSGAFSLSGGTVDATTFTKTPAASGGFAFRATYAGDSVYESKVGPCEPLAVTKLTPGVRTDIHNAAHGVILNALSGDVVHDKVFVTKPAGAPASVPAPTGNVVFHRYTTINCTGTPVDQTVALAADGTAETSTFTVSADMSYKASYQGDAIYAAGDGACEPLTVAVPLKGHIMHTQVTCSDFVSNNPSDELDSAQYGVKSGVVNNLSPGVMFYYITIKAPSPSFTINVTQSNNRAWRAIPVQDTKQIILYEANCTNSSKGSPSYAASIGTATLTVTGATTGATYIVGIKYSLSGLAGQAVSSPPPVVTYSFATNFNGGAPIVSSQDSITVTPKP